MDIPTNNSSIYFTRLPLMLTASSSLPAAAVRSWSPSGLRASTSSPRKEGLAKLPPLTTRYTRIALTQKLRRIIDEGVGYGLALEGISAADVARAK